MEPKKWDERKADTDRRAKKEHVAEAHEEALRDIAMDADFSLHSENDDLDEGELSRLGEDENGVI
ncbi:MAG TPA: hypothetical protein VHB48_07960 [Chitinophagaceae bacterium]|jgi:hypothetical protein|nr:hypothetical protein [Chitinophagaceae bacterium]